jgi:hypothetical protein
MAAYFAVVANNGSTCHNIFVLSTLLVLSTIEVESGLPKLPSRATGWTSRFRFLAGSRDFFYSTVSRVGLRVGRPGFDSWLDQEIFSTPQYPDWICGPPNRQWEFFPEIKRPGREAGHSHLVLRLRMVELYRHFSMRLHEIVLSCLINLAQGQLYFKKVPL